MSHGRILLTGTTKVIGRYILDECLRRGLPVCALVRPSSNVGELSVKGVKTVVGDLNNPAHLTGALEGQGLSTVIHVPNLAAIQDMPGLLESYLAAGIRRGIFISSTGIFTTLPARTKPLRLAAERAIEASGIEATILRPTLVYGDPEDGNISRLVRYCRRSPLMPIFGAGNALQQPVHLQDLAAAAVTAATLPRTPERAYNVGGGETLPYRDLVRRVYRAAGRRGALLHLPARPAASLARSARRFGLRLPVREEQILRLEEDKAYDVSAAKRDLAFNPRTFDAGLRSLLELMGER